MKYIKYGIEFIAVCSIVILLIILPSINSFFIEKHVFNNEYYNIVSGIIGGIITLYALSLQFQHERAKLNEENLMKSRCFFKINYINRGMINNRLINYYCKSNSQEDDVKAKFYLAFKLVSTSFINECKIEINSEPKININLGIIVANQFFIVPINLSKKISMNIFYRTQVNEKIKHSVFIEDISKYKVEADEKIEYYRNGKYIELLNCKCQIFCLDMEEYKLD